MSGEISETNIIKAIGHPIMGALGALLTWMTTGWTGSVPPTLAALLSALGGICALAFSLLYRRYFGVLGATKRRGTPERAAYDALRESLAGGNLATRLYAKWLTKFLDWIEKFFGDAGMADRTLLPHAFWLKKPAPLWTAPAFDRCLILALIYPIATIFLIWTISGDVGPAERAIELAPNVAGWSRGLATGATVVLCFATLQAIVTAGRKQIIWLTVAAAVGFVAIRWLVPAVVVPNEYVFAGSFNGILALVVAYTAAFIVIGAYADPLRILRTGSGWIGCILANTFGDAGALAGASIGAGIGTTAALSVTGLKDQWRGVFLSLFLVTMIVSCLGAAELLSPFATWRATGPLLLFLGLLTLLNAPFDWASLGLSRALLRRGLELGGWWPYVLALADACLAGVIIALLALTMVVGVQAFDELAVHGGGKPVLPLDVLFDGLAKNPAAPEYWWVYALLLSSMIPSIVNLMIGGTSLMRGLPGLPALLLRFMPEAKAVPVFDRTWLALVLTGQIFLGAALGVGAQALLAWGLVLHVMPWVGLDLLEVARAVAAFDLPSRVAQLFTGTH